jgi:hypothetical protein
VQAIGTAESVAEIGEQLAWLGSALRSSPQDEGLVCCAPTINYVDSGSLSHFEIGFVFSTPVHSRLSPSHCWHNLFRNPTLVLGYPIPKRSHIGHGLEIPLNIMAGLAHTARATVFEGKLFLKGFSTMLIPTRLSDEMLIWHLVYKENGDHISYLESELPHANGIGLSDFEKYRHILGWCADARYYAGT